jgi:hypothetical protein
MPSISPRNSISTARGPRVVEFVEAFHRGLAAACAAAGEQRQDPVEQQLSGGGPLEFAQVEIDLLACVRAGDVGAPAARRR